MSRIAGILMHRPDPAAEFLVRSMLERLDPTGRADLRTAGPGPAVLGACGRGLAVTPLGVLALDGLVYNQGLGPDDDDAALLAERIGRHGFEATVAGLIGDFALAWYDRAAGCLHLARDQVGAKPLYYAHTPTFTAFASTPGPLLGLPGVGTQPNRRFVALFAASHYRTIDNDPQATPFADVRQLPIAHLARVKGEVLVPAPYWSLGEQPEIDPGGRPEATYRELLLDAVGIRLKRVRRPAFTLSGGMDSSSVLACARFVAKSPQAAFSCVYSDKTFDETEEIQAMLAENASAWTPLTIEPQDVQATIREMVSLHEEPVATATWLAHYRLCREVSGRGHDALFGGLGGDELNAGEFEYFPFFFADLLAEGRQDLFEREVACWARHHDHPIHKKDRDQALALLRGLTDPAVPGLCRPNLERINRYSRALDPDFFDLGTFWPVMDRIFSSCLKNRTCHDLFRETAPCCLRAQDRHASRFGLASLTPFLDPRLIEFMFRVPGRLKIRDGVAKHLLRQAMQGILPEQTRTRVRKMGWNAPAHLWFSGQGAQDLRDRIRSSAFGQLGIYDQAEVLRLLDEHQEIVARGLHKENHMMFFWQLSNLLAWFEIMPRLCRKYATDVPPGLAAPGAAEVG